MKFGVCIPNYGTSLSVDYFLLLALESEKLGFDSVWTTDHILMPRNSGTPYERIFDSITSLAFLAAQTKKVRVGISSLIIAMRNPIEVAKQLATVDCLSGGRLMLAIGTGWCEKEFSFVGSDFHSRGKRVNESIRLIKSLWGGEKHFQSEIIPQNYTDAMFEPRPIQDKLNIWIGGVSKSAMQRAADLGDAWHPNVAPLDIFKEMVSQFRRISPNSKNKPLCVRIGLDAKATQSEYRGPQGERRILLSSNLSQNREVLSELEKLGVSYVVIATNPDGKLSAQDQIEGLRIIAKEFISS